MDTRSLELSGKVRPFEQRDDRRADAAAVVGPHQVDQLALGATGRQQINDLKNMDRHPTVL
jgi:hypothetical protein